MNRSISDIEFLEDYEEKTQPMKCASAEAEARTYRRVDIGNQIWLIANQPNAADNIYSWRPGPSDGFGGRTIKFKLDTGEVLKLKGPWHSAAGKVLLEKFPQLEEQHLTFGVVALDRQHIDGSFRRIYRHVIHRDEDWVLGRFDRIEEIAQEWADILDREVYFYSQSQGGSTSSRALPKEKEGCHESQ